MAEDVVAIAPAPVAPGAAAPVLIKTVLVRDAKGRSVEVQAIVNVDSDGVILDPLTEETGQQIVQLLIDIKSVLINGGGFE